MTIYQPAEDSYLLSRVLKQQLPILLEENPNLLFLEIGAGSGIHLETAKSVGVKDGNIFSGDLDTRAVAHCTSLGFNCVQSDLFENIPGKFSVIVFNPPYLPQDSREPEDSQMATTGGEKGSEVINKFLEQAKRHLTENGKIFLITSSLAKDLNFAGYTKKLLGNEKLFMEELFVWELMR